MANKPPTYPHHAKDWLVGTAHLSLEQQGAYQRLLDYEWDEGKLPADPELLGRLVGLPADEFQARIWSALSQHFFEKNGALYNRRLESERRKQVLYRKEQERKGILSGRLRAEQRLNRGSTDVPTGGQPDGNPSSSSSSSPSGTRTSPKSSWLTPYDLLWRQHFDAALPYGQAGKVLRPLETAHGPEAVRAALGHYLDAHHGERSAYVSLPKFAATFGQWRTNGKPKSAQDRNLAAIDRALGGTDGES